eukprot:9726553-Ditylum_brightwellii.AAC.1
MIPAFTFCAPQLLRSQFQNKRRNYIFTDIFFQRKNHHHPQQSCSSPFTTTSAQDLNCTINVIPCLRHIHCFCAKGTDLGSVYSASAQNWAA